MSSNNGSGGNIVILMIAVAIIGCNSFLISPILNDIALSLSASTAQVARVISAYGGATALSSLFLAPYVGKVGITRAIRFAGMLMVAGIALSGISVSWLMLTFAQSLAGVAAGLMLPAIYTLTSDLAPAGEKSKALGRVITGWSLAMVIGIPLSALIADMTNWRVAYGLMVILGLLFLLFSRRLPVIDTPVETLGFPFAEYRKNPDILIMFVVTFLYMTSFYGLYSFVGSFARDSFYNSASLAGLISMAYGIGFGMASLKAKWIDKFSPQFSSYIIFITIALIYGILSVSASSIYLLLVTCLLWGAANHFGLNVIVSLLIQLNPAYKTATLGMYSALSYSGTMIGGLVYGYIFNRQGFTTIAYISLVLCVIAAFLAWFTFNYKPRTHQYGLNTKKKS